MPDSFELSGIFLAGIGSFFLSLLPVLVESERLPPLFFLSSFSAQILGS